jgi:hypothetical protein
LGLGFLLQPLELLIDFLQRLALGLGQNDPCGPGIRFLLIFVVVSEASASVQKNATTQASASVLFILILSS